MADNGKPEPVLYLFLGAIIFFMGLIIGIVVVGSPYAFKRSASVAARLPSEVKAILDNQALSGSQKQTLLEDLFETSIVSKEDGR